eukprot:7443675-Heterocapsa_arctica.AAC.1
MLVVFRVAPPWMDVVSGVGVGAGILLHPVLSQGSVLMGDEGVGLCVVGAVDGCCGGFDSKHLALIRD